MLGEHSMLTELITYPFSLYIKSLDKITPSLSYIIPTFFQVQLPYPSISPLGLSKCSLPLYIFYVIYLLKVYS